MSVESTATATTLQQPDIGFITNTARSLVWRQLGQLQSGQIAIHEHGKTTIYGASIAGQPLAELEVSDSSVWRDFMTGGGIGAAESYVAGDWNSPDLTAALRYFARSVDQLNAFEDRFGWLSKPLMKGLHWVNRNTREGSRKNIHAHYDLGNELFEAFLDPSMMYSSAIFPTPDTSLDDAQTFKLDRICQKLQLTADDHVIEIGTGWGGFAIHAAQHYGCRVTTTTISDEQYALACERVAAAGLNDRITLLKQDYRDLGGQYSKLVSIEMIEAVGAEFLQSYLQVCARLLRPDGVALLQAITLPDQRYARALKNVEFIQRYIFPGSFIPSLGAIQQAAGQGTDLRLVYQEDFGSHYATTLRRWRERFLAAEPRIRQLGFDDAFIRLWTFYFCYCEAGFTERAIGVSHLMFAKPDYRGDSLSVTSGA